MINYGILTNQGGLTDQMGDEHRRQPRMACADTTCSGGIRRAPQVQDHEDGGPELAGRHGMVLEDAEVTLKLGTEAEATMHWFRVWSRPAPRAPPCKRMLAEVRHDLLGEGLELLLRLIP
jgi:hypothetical protein